MFGVAMKKRTFSLYLFCLFLVLKAYGLDDWTQKYPSSKPSERYGHSMAYIGGDKVLLFGPYPKEETWTYNLSTNTWTNKNPASNPSNRSSHDMAYIGNGQVLLFGGWDSNIGARVNETWIYDLSLNNWRQDTNTDQPSARDYHALSETSMNGSSYLVLFGGNDGSSDDETWTFGGGDYSLPVVLTSFTAAAGDHRVSLKWITESEIDNLGYNIHRSQTIDAGYIKINPSIIPGAGSTSEQHEYNFLDLDVFNGITYFYLLETVDYFGNSEFHDPVSATPVQDVLPLDIFLHQNYPNPLNPETKIAFDLPDVYQVRIDILNQRGQVVLELCNQKYTAGHHEVLFDGAGLASGIYLYQLQAGEFIDTRKFMLLR